MNQIKHLLFACLVLVCIVLGFVFVRTISSAKPAVSGPAPYDYLGSDTIPLPPGLAKGKRLFTHSCASCHALNKTISAPALQGVTGRGPWGNRKNLYDWVRDPASFMAKDPYTKRLREQYGYVMIAFPALTDDDIEAIINYVESGNTRSQNMPVAITVNHESSIRN